MNEAELIRRAMSALGKRTSERKKISSRKNAKRPRKKKGVSDGLKQMPKHLQESSIRQTCNALHPIPVAEVYIDPTQFPKA